MGSVERKQEVLWMCVMILVTVGLLVWMGSRGRMEINRIIVEMEEKERRGEDEGGEEEGEGDRERGEREVLMV